MFTLSQLFLKVAIFIRRPDRLIAINICSCHSSLSLSLCLSLPFFSTCHPPPPTLCCLFPYSCLCYSFDYFLLCVVDTVLLSTTSSLCLRPTTGPPSVFVFPTFTLNSSSLSTTSWSGTVQCSVFFPQHLHLASSNGTCLRSFTGTGTL